MPPEDTLAVGTLNLVLYAAEQRGADGAALRRAVGLTAEQLRDPDGRVPIATVQRLWAAATEATGDPDLSLRVGELINPAAIGILAYVMMHSPTVRRALEHLCRYQDIVCSGVQTTLHHSGDWAIVRLTLTSSDIIYPAHALNSELAMYLSALRALTGRTVPLHAVQLGYPEPADTREHERIFAPARLTFGTAETQMVFDRSFLDVPILNANPGLFPLFEQHAEAMLRTLRQPASFSSRVKAEIVQLLKGEEPTLATIADRLALGIRTLQGRLREEGVSYQQLLDEVRRELAETHLRQPHLSTTDIAYLLGYSEPSVFFRSFKKWTGQTPGMYRQTA
jgi:AraC-like DNA-binding protein